MSLSSCIYRHYLTGFTTKLYHVRDRRKMGETLRKTSQRAPVWGRARLHRLRKNSGSIRFWEGHDFSRAAKSFRPARALAPEMCFLRPRPVFPQPVQPCRQESIKTRALAPEGPGGWLRSPQCQQRDLRRHADPHREAEGSEPAVHIERSLL